MRALKALVVGMGVAIVVATVALVVVLVQRSGGRGVEPMPRLALDLPAGSQIVGVAGAGDRFAVLVRRPDGERILFLDPRSGRVVGEAFPGASPGPAR